jgi:hypothetical protein
MESTGFSKRFVSLLPDNTASNPKQPILLIPSPHKNLIPYMYISLKSLISVPFCNLLIYLLSLIMTILYDQQQLYRTETVTMACVVLLLL